MLLLFVWLWLNDESWCNSPIDISLCCYWGIVDSLYDTCFLILATAVSCRVPISGHLAEEPTSSKRPRNLGGKPQPRRQSLAKSWLKAEDFGGWGDSGAMNFLQCGQSDQESRPEPESGARQSRSREMWRGGRRGKAEIICYGETIS